MFKEIDVDNNGSICVDELKMVVKKEGETAVQRFQVEHRYRYKVGRLGGNYWLEDVVRPSVNPDRRRDSKEGLRSATG